MVDKLGTFTTALVGQIGKKLVDKGVLTQEEMDEILNDACEETYRIQQKRREEMSVCNTHYTNIN